jgi:phage-related protein
MLTHKEVLATQFVGRLREKHQETGPASLGLGLWEVRSNLTSNRIARVIFTLHEDRMWLLHGFIKKTQKTPQSDIDLARKRKKEVKK